jgi:hypothetical protein
LSSHHRYRLFLVHVHLQGKSVGCPSGFAVHQVTSCTRPSSRGVNGLSFRVRCSTGWHICHASLDWHKLRMHTRTPPMLSQTVLRLSKGARRPNCRPLGNSSGHDPGRWGLRPQTPAETQRYPICVNVCQVFAIITAVCKHLCVSTARIRNCMAHIANSDLISSQTTSEVLGTIAPSSVGIVLFQAETAPGCCSSA